MRQTEAIQAKSPIKLITGSCVGSTQKSCPPKILETPHPPGGRKGGLKVLPPLKWPKSGKWPGSQGWGLTKKLLIHIWWGPMRSTRHPKFFLGLPQKLRAMAKIVVFF